MKAPVDPIALVEAAYDLAATDDAWLERIAQLAATALDGGMGVAAFRYDASDPKNFTWTEPIVAAGGSRMRSALHEANASLPAPAVAQLFGRGPTLVTASEQTGLGAQFAEWPPGARYRERYGAVDLVALKISDPTHRGLLIYAPLPAVAAVGEGLRAPWSSIAAHVSAGLRLRRAWTQREEPGEAVIEPDGRVVHAEGPARAASARDRLRQAVRDQERARGPLRRLDGAEALAIWQGLVVGRWSIVERFDSDGRRFLVARRNDPDLPPDPRGLTLRERQVLGYIALGQSCKEIAYNVGLAPSTVSEHLSRALRKLGLASRAEAARVLGVRRVG